MEIRLLQVGPRRNLIRGSIPNFSFRGMICVRSHRAKALPFWDRREATKATPQAFCGGALWPAACKTQGITGKQVCHQRVPVSCIRPYTHTRSSVCIRSVSLFKLACISCIPPVSLFELCLDVGGASGLYPLYPADVGTLCMHTDRCVLEWFGGDRYFIGMHPITGR